jgi:hypothetical protein
LHQCGTNANVSLIFSNTYRLMMVTTIACMCHWCNLCPNLTFVPSLGPSTLFTHAHTCMHTHMHAHPHACTPTCMHTHMHAHPHAHTHMHTHTHMPHTHAHPHTCTHPLHQNTLFTHTDSHTHTDTHTHTDAHTHTQILTHTDIHTQTHTHTFLTHIIDISLNILINGANHLSCCEC